MSFLDDQERGLQIIDREKKNILSTQAVKFEQLYPVSSVSSMFHARSPTGFSALLARKIADAATTDGKMRRDV